MELSAVKYWIAERNDIKKSMVAFIVETDSISFQQKKWIIWESKQKYHDYLIPKMSKEDTIVKYISGEKDRFYFL